MKYYQFNMTDFAMIQSKIYENNKAKGWYDEPRSNGEIIALIHSELSEALEADRKNDEGEYIPPDCRRIESDKEFKMYFESEVKDSYWDEMADAMIRILDHAQHNGIDLAGHIQAKVRYNELRPHKHGGKKY